jgi:type VI secretion system secreted protein VgrG
MAIPRIGHEVIVSFLEGDPDRPIITGRVFNAASPVPYPLPEDKTRTVFKSLSSLGGKGFNELRVEDRKGQEEIFVHAEKDVNVHVINDWKEHILRDQHRTVDNFSYSIVKGEDQQTVEKDRKVELLSNDHLTVRGSSHSRYGDDWLLHAGTESHVAAGRKTVIEAGSELTIKAGGGFIRIDPSGVYVGGAKVRINSGGSPGVGSGAAPLQPGRETNAAIECSSNDGPTQHMGSMGSLLSGTGDPVPAIVTSEEEICRVIMAVKGSEAIQTGLSQVVELTRNNGVEYSGWILEDSPGQYSVSVIKKGEATKEIVCYSLEVDFVIDLIDYVVISENEIGEKYPNAGKQLPYDIMKYLNP